MTKPDSALPLPNRRRDVRARVPHLAQLFIGRRPIGNCVVEDLSVTGMRVVTTGSSSVRKGRTVTLLTQLPGRKALVVHARIARTERLRGGKRVLGLAFVRVSSLDVERIRQIVIDHLSETSLSLVFFDTSEDGRPKRIVVGDDETLQLPPVPIASAG